MAESTGQAASTGPRTTEGITTMNSLSRLQMELRYVQSQIENDRQRAALRRQRSWLPRRRRATAPDSACCTQTA
jgi:hypothetical protein